jgi:serine/threonine protein kinase
VSTPLPLGGIGFLRHRTGDRIKGRYEVLDHLGGGNFGSVYRVRDEAVGNVLACKEMHVLNDPDTPGDERLAALDPFKREALNLATLRHPHIPAAYFEQEDGEWRVCPRCGLDFGNAAFCPAHGAALLPMTQRYYLMMDYIDGPTLEEMVVEYSKNSGKPLPEDQCVEWTAQIASALRSLHIVGIVHRDVKPDNIKIRSADNAAVLLDFGLTKKAEEAGAYGTARLSGTGRFGTPGYAPPGREEQERPEPRSDIYALGMTLYRLLSGRDPQDENQLREMTEQAPRQFNAALSPEVERIIQSATQIDRTRRCQSIDDLLGDLNELRGGTASTQHAPPFTFSDGSRARTPTDLARLLDSHPEESQNYLFNGMFAGWLRQNGFAAPARMAEDVVKKHESQPPRALEMFRRALYPPNSPGALPRLQIEPSTLSFGGIESGSTSTQILRLRNAGAGLVWGKIAVDEPGGAGSAEAGLPGLSVPDSFEGNDVKIEVALDTGQVSLGAYAGDVLLQTETETLRVPVSYTVQPLQLRVEPPELDFGTILVGKRAVRRLRILRDDEVKGGGRPRGTIYAGESLGGLVAPPRFTGDHAIEVTADGGMPDAIAKSYEGALQLDTNGGRLRVPVRYSFVLPPIRWLVLVLSAAFTGALCAAVMRALYAAVNLEYAWRWLNESGRIVPLELTSLRVPVLVGALAGAFYSVWWTARNWDEDRQTPLPHLQRTSQRTRRNSLQMIAQSMTLCTLLGASLCWPLVWALHWLFWGLGDWILWPFLRALSPRLTAVSAPLAWGIIGGVGGALHGLARGFAATGRTWARYAVYTFFAFAFFALLIHAMVAAP